MKTMKIVPAIFLFIVFIAFIDLSCQQNKTTIEGDLYFGFFRYGSFYNQPDSLVRSFKMYVDTVDRRNLSDLDQKVFKIYETLQKEDLVFNPFVELRLDNDSIIKLYLNKSDYDKIKRYKRQELQASNKKIRIKIESKELGNGMVVCKNLISVDKIDGQTFQLQKKFKIEDYR